MITIDIVIKMPRAEIVLTNEPNQPTFILSLTTDDMVILVKDKFSNWKDLIKRVADKKLQ